MAIVRVTLFKAFPGKEEQLVKQLIENVRIVREAMNDTELMYISTGPTVGGNTPYHSTIVAKYPDLAALEAYDVHPAHIATRSTMNGFVEERYVMIYEVAQEG